eukprot:7388190-Prymnesium_polylepis.2
MNWVWFYVAAHARRVRRGSPLQRCRTSVKPPNSRCGKGSGVLCVHARPLCVARAAVARRTARWARCSRATPTAELKDGRRMARVRCEARKVGRTHLNSHLLNKRMRMGVRRRAGNMGATARRGR